MHSGIRNRPGRSLPPALLLPPEVSHFSMLQAPRQFTDDVGNAFMSYRSAGRHGPLMSLYQPRSADLEALRQGASPVPVG